MSRKMQRAVHDAMADIRRELIERAWFGNAEPLQRHDDPVLHDKLYPDRSADPEFLNWLGHGPGFAGALATSRRLFARSVRRFRALREVVMAKHRTLRPEDQVLQSPLLQLTPRDALRVMDVVQNLSITGQPGSGKTSSMAALARSLLIHGTGLLVFCAKADERALWERYCRETNRTASLLIFDGKRHRYNFIAAQLARHGFAGINIIVEALLYVLDAARALGGTVNKGDVFWEDILRLLLRHALPILYLATGTITISDIIALVRSAPRTSSEMGNPEWQERSAFFGVMRDAFPKMDEAMREQMLSFWRDEWMALEPKIKSSASISLCTTLDRFTHGWLND